MNALKVALQAMQSNPLTSGLPPRMDDKELFARLRASPITPENVLEIPLQARQELVTVFKQIFVPTPQSLKISSHIQDMLYTGLHHRDPRAAHNRRFVFESGNVKGREIGEVPWWSSYATGSVIEGITGTGKSHVVDAFLRLFPQVVDHGANEQAGWKALKQLVWLKVHMPSDGTRGGFLQGAFLELDKALDANYTNQYKGPTWTVEKRLVVFLHLLAVHRCGVLIIEEAQENNLSVNVFGKDFLTFFLRLLNWGVPTVLVGNPLAFRLLRTFSQNVDRFSEGGWFTTHPILSADHHTWRQQWIPDLWLPTLLDEPDEPYQPFSEHPLDQTLEGFIWRRTGGFQRNLYRLRRAVQLHALRSGQRRVTAGLVDTVYQTSEMMIPMQTRIEAFVNRDSKALSAFSDIPADTYAQLWAGLGRSPQPIDRAQRADHPVVNQGNKMQTQDAPATARQGMPPPKKRAARNTKTTVASADGSGKWASEFIDQLRAESGVTS